MRIVVYLASAVLLYFTVLGMAGFGLFLLIVAIFPRAKKGSFIVKLAGIITIAVSLLFTIVANGIILIGGRL